MSVEENWNVPVLWQVVILCHPNDVLQPHNTFYHVNLRRIDVAKHFFNFEDYLRWVSKWIIFGQKYELGVGGRLKCASALAGCYMLPQ